MSATIEVYKKSVKSFLETGKENLFVIPEYQRPYEWEDEHIQTLFDDLWEFMENNLKENDSEDNDSKSTYFLGCIVSFINANGEREIIDGQQRITSLFLLLRAIYTNLEAYPEKNREINNFISKITPTLWREDKYTGEVDQEQILLESRVLNNDGNAILHDILCTGKADPKAQDNYSKNYIQFQNLFKNVSSEKALNIYDFILTVLDETVVFPISADSQDTALKIFTTLNNRGLPLSEADIFKAEIYHHLGAEDKSDFIDQWSRLDEDSASASESIQKLFYYYMFYLRALNNDKNSTTPGNRKYYLDNKEKNLFADDLMLNLERILNIWKVVTLHEELEGESWSSNDGIKKTLDVLTSYPNEFWKYPVIIYYLVHGKENDFESEFALFLNKLLSTLLSVYLFSPTLNAVKADIIKLNIAITQSAQPQFEFKAVDISELDAKIKTPHRNAVRMLLKILAYDKQEALLPTNWHIEHIFPQSWQSNYFPNVSDDVVRERIEHLGNKLPFEKRLNIKASNGFFERKKKLYADSDIIITKEFSMEYSDWGLEEIIERDLRVSDRIKEILSDWDTEYDNVLSNSSSVESPSEEDLAKIEEFKKKGWV